MRIYIGIDPGASETTPGAIAWISEEGEFLECVDLPIVKGQGLDIPACRSLLLNRLGSQPQFATIETQQAMPGQGVSSTFHLGETFGALRAILMGLSIPFQQVRPALWTKAMGIPGKADKDIHREFAMRLFPQAAGDLRFKKNHGRADALLIAEWGRRKHRSLKVELPEWQGTIAAPPPRRESTSFAEWAGEEEGES